MSLPSLPRRACWYRRVATRVSPAQLYQLLYDGESHSFLYESLEAHGGRGRYSFMGARPMAVFEARGEQLTLTLDGETHRSTGDARAALRALLPDEPDTPPVAPFCGGAVGYLSYDTIRWFESIPAENPDDLKAPDACFLFPQEVLCFDHLERVMHVLLFDEDGCAARFEAICGALERCPREAAPAPLPNLPDSGPLGSNMERARFEEMVARAKDYILAGDIFQVVLSQRFEFPLEVTPLRMYQALRRTNPSPYMYYLRFDDLHIAGSSPEVLVRAVGRHIVTRPLAGTRRRGASEAEDAALAAELLADPKERAEHVMLVDLGRNDLGRVCEYDSIALSDVLTIERHSKVMHLVSHVEGWMRDEPDVLDAFGAVFPAGTVSGAPKVRAMEIIEELEPVRRGIYAGAIGYFSRLGDLDMCIAIRTMVMRGGRGFVQAGAGVVADSVPAKEYEETVNKAKALQRAVALAHSDAEL